MERLIGFLGPEGTFAQAAAQQLVVTMPDDIVLRPFRSVVAALQAVREGEAEAALVPMENSVEGSVPATLDELAVGTPLMIVAETSLPVQFHLWAPPGRRREDLARITTHPHAQAQCRNWLHDNLSGVEVVPAMSTATAAVAVAEDPEHYHAAIAAPWAGTPLGLVPLAEEIADNPDASTRFVLVARRGQPPRPTGTDKTSLVLFMHQDQPGALLNILTEFSVRGVNLTRIESRPTKKIMGDYFFVVDCEGHVEDQRVGEALRGLHRVCADVRFLGSYARHDGKAPVVRPGTGNADFVESSDWLRQVRSGGL